MRQPWINPPLTKEDIHCVFLSEGIKSFIRQFTYSKFLIHSFDIEKPFYPIVDLSLTMLASLISPIEMILNSTSTITGGPEREN